jgi:antirestriction protein ArdC
MAMTSKDNPRVDQAIKSLDQGVAAISDSEEFKRYLSFVSSFHDYSWGNCMLIARQMPEATLVAGYRAWQRKGRQVRKGESSLAILAPLVGKKEDDDGERVPHVFGFRCASVFDVSQTDGDPLPEAPTPRQLVGESEDHMALFQMLCAYCKAHDLSIEYAGEDVLGEANGSYSRKTNTLTVKEFMPALHTTKTLLHEVVHSRLHSSEAGVSDQDLSELEAEGTAFVISAAFSIDTSEYSFGYIAGWAEQPERLRSALGTIQKTAHVLIEDLHQIWKSEPERRFTDSA